jgi:hypothetical protein
MLSRRTRFRTWRERVKTIPSAFAVPARSVLGPSWSDRLALLRRQIRPKRDERSALIKGLLAMPRRSSRPLTNTLEKLSIKMLKEWDLLHVGCNNQKKFDNGTVIATTLSGQRQTRRIGQGKKVLILRLESRPLGRGLVWYFSDPVSGALCTKLFLADGLIAGRKTVGALYRSQFQDKMYRKLLRMGKLIGAIKGDPDSNLGPGRGSRKLKNVERLRQKVSEMVANQELLEKPLDKYPELGNIPRTAMAILRREFPKLPREWEKFDRLQKKTARSLYDFEDRL